MPTIDITRTYNDTALLSESDLDNIINDTQTFLNTTKLDGTNIQNEGIDGGDKFAPGSVTTAKFQSNTVTTAKLADSPDGIEAAKFNDLAVTTAKINDAAITTSKINAAAVSYAKLAAVTTTISSSSGSFSTTSDSYVTVTNQSAAATTTGRPVLISITTTSTDGTAKTNVTNDSNGGIAFLRIQRNGTTIYESIFSRVLASGVQFFFTNTIDQPAAGSNTYTVDIKRTNFSPSNVTLAYTNLQIRAVEL